MIQTYDTYMNTHLSTPPRSVRLFPHAGQKPGLVSSRVRKEEGKPKGPENHKTQIVGNRKARAVERVVAVDSTAVRAPAAFSIGGFCETPLRAGTEVEVDLCCKEPARWHRCVFNKDMIEMNGKKIRKKMRSHSGGQYSAHQQVRNKGAETAFVRSSMSGRLGNKERQRRSQNGRAYLTEIVHWQTTSHLEPKSRMTARRRQKRTHSLF
ncbi:hypothetical protein EW146_g7385 [Bondarzewia mesenterica]|uniref:Uncharacterized protein n=1 Tax=Bondarzewia mesenterica TaxID=1095465 RepID=A0A4S4LLI1_9AGAM|nr:hypothetical protein EW146_g7385 [Bondarzewia mesenterica]